MRGARALTDSKWRAKSPKVTLGYLLQTVFNDGVVLRIADPMCFRYTARNSEYASIEQFCVAHAYCSELSTSLNSAVDNCELCGQHNIVESCSYQY